MALDRVERLKQDFDIEVDWRGWEIHPEFPPAGLPRSAFGSPRTHAVSDNVRALAGEIGLTIKSPDPLSNTHLALRASELAREAGLFEPFHRALFEAYFQQEKNIGELAVLREVASGVGLDTEVLEEALASEKHEDRLRQVRAEVYELGCTGVPTFAIDDVWITGAMPIEMLRRMLQRAGAQERSHGRP